MPPWMGTDPSLSSRVIGAWSSTVGNRISCVGSGSGPCSAAGAQVQRTRLQPAAEIFQACAVSSTFPFPQHQNVFRDTLFPYPHPTPHRLALRNPPETQDTGSLAPAVLFARGPVPVESVSTRSAARDSDPRPCDFATSRNPQSPNWASPNNSPAPSCPRDNTSEGSWLDNRAVNTWEVAVAQQLPRKSSHYLTCRWLGKETRQSGCCWFDGQRGLSYPSAPTKAAAFISAPSCLPFTILNRHCPPLSTFHHRPTHHLVFHHSLFTCSNVSISSRPPRLSPRPVAATSATHSVAQHLGRNLD